MQHPQGGPPPLFGSFLAPSKAGGNPLGISYLRAVLDPLQLLHRGCFMAKAASGMRFSRAQVAECFGVAATTVDAWVKRGCPVAQRGSRGVEWVFNSADVARWLRDSAVAEATGDDADPMEDLRLRKLRAETEVAELELAKAKASVVDLPAVERVLGSVMSELQVRLRALPGRVAPAALGETDETVFKRVLLEEIDAALEKLAAFDVSTLIDSDDDDVDDEDGEGSE